MIQKTDGIVLRRQEIRETSLVLTVFTPHLGKIQGLVKGVRGARAAVPWYLEPLTLQSMVLYERRHSAWALISSFDLIDAFDPIRRDFSRTAYAAYGLDLVDALTGVNDSHPEIFDLLLKFLRALGGPQESNWLVRALEARLLKMSGLLPQPGALSLSAAAKTVLEGLLQTPLPQALSVPATVEREIRLKLQSLLHGVLERDLKSRSFLQSVSLENGLAAA